MDIWTTQLWIKLFDYFYCAICWNPQYIKSTLLQNIFGALKAVCAPSTYILSPVEVKSVYSNSSIFVKHSIITTVHINWSLYSWFLSEPLTKYYWAVKEMHRAIIPAFTLTNFWTLIWMQIMTLIWEQNDFNCLHAQTDTVIKNIKSIWVHYRISNLPNDWLLHSLWAPKVVITRDSNYFQKPGLVIDWTTFQAQCYQWCGSFDLLSFW